MAFWGCGTGILKGRPYRKNAQNVFVHVSDKNKTNKKRNRSVDLFVLLET